MVAELFLITMGEIHMKRKKTIITAHSFMAVIDGNTPYYETFSGTIELLKTNALKQYVALSDKEITDTIKITEEDFERYMKSDRAPKEVFSSLRSSYKEYLQNAEVVCYMFHEAIPDPLFSETKKKLKKNNRGSKN